MPKDQLAAGKFPGSRSPVDTDAKRLPGVFPGESQQPILRLEKVNITEPQGIQLIFQTAQKPEMGQ